MYGPAVSKADMFSLYRTATIYPLSLHVQTKGLAWHHMKPAATVWKASLTSGALSLDSDTDSEEFGQDFLYPMTQLFL